MAANDGQHRVPERGYGMGYQESVEIETKASFGMSADEYYRRQVGLVLDETPKSLYGESDSLNPRKFDPNSKLPEGVTLKKKAANAGMKLVDRLDLGIGSGKKVLDLAVGEGDTSRYLATTGASVEARDYEDHLVTRGKERDREVREGHEVDDIQSGVSGRANSAIGHINYAQGDYSRIKESIGGDEKFDAITCLSRSFIYLGERANYVKALKDFNDLLVPGGKVVLQSRNTVKESTYPWAEDMGAKIGYTPEGEFTLTDETKGTKFVWRAPTSTVNLSDGVRQRTASRYLEYADGTTKELGEVTADDHLDLSNLNGMGEMLREAGFTNIQIKIENLSSDGSEIMFAISAEKPKEKVVSGLGGALRDRVGKLMGRFGKAPD